MAVDFKWTLYAEGAIANRPAAGTDGRFYYSTDEYILYRDNGTAWANIASGTTAVILKSLFDANTILKADVDNTPEALTVAEQRLVGRITDGVITALTAAQVATLIQASIDHGSIAGLTHDDHTQYVLKSLFATNSILARDSLETPRYCGVLEERLVGRITDGLISGLDGAQVMALLSGTAGAEFLFNTQQVGGVVDPTTDQQVATKKYTDDAIDTDIGTHTDDLDAHHRDPHEIVKVGDYYVGHISGDHYDFNYGANKLHAVPLNIPRDLTADRIAIDVEVAHVDAKFRLGIYADTGSVYPGALVVDAGEVSVDSTGVVAATIDEALTKGLYWVAFVTDSATVKICGLANIPSVPPLGLPAAYFHVALGHVEHAFTYGVLSGANPFPDTSPTWLYASGLMPIRIASLD